MKISRNLFMVLLPASVFLTWPVSVYAEPSVKETKAFIIDKFEVCGNFRVYYDLYTMDGQTTSNLWESKIDVSFVEDVMHIHSDSVSRTKEISLNNPSYKKAWTTRTSVKLSDLVPEVWVTHERDARVNAPKINFECTTGKCIKIKTTVTLHTEEGEDLGGLGVSETKLNKDSLNVCTYSSAASVNKALLHLIKKSGGKKPLF